MSDAICSSTGSRPCPVCGTCHFNACPDLFGGDPERPDCQHNDPHQWPEVTCAQLLAGLTATRDADQDDRFARLLHTHTTTEEDA